MISNYFKIAWRNIWKNKIFSFINIISLSIGICASMIIGMMVYFESTFDIFHKNGDSIYRITSDFINPEGTSYNPGVPVPLTRTLQDGLTGVEISNTFFLSEPVKVENNDNDLIYKKPNEVIYTDENYFSLFRYKWLAGSPNDALIQPNEVVLEKSRAKKYFPKIPLQQILGKTLVYNDSINTTVTGVVENISQRTDFIFKEFISLQTGIQSELKRDLTSDNWNSTNSSTQLFIKLNSEDNEAAVLQQLQALAENHESLSAKKYGSRREFHLQPLEDLHFNTNYGVFDNGNSHTSKTVLTGLILVASFLLLLGCINFVNLNTAQATQRAKEIGIRKTLGSSKKQLIFQFLAEAFLLTSFATILSLILTSVLFKVFSEFLPQNLTFDFLLNPVILVSLGILIITVSLLSGLYPAFILTRFKPISVLKGQLIKGQSKSRVRQSLTVFQFVVAQFFIIATLLVGKQIHFLLTKDMGFKTDAVAYVRTPWSDHDFSKRDLLLQKIKAIPQITAASLGGDAPASTNIHSTDIDFKDGKKEVHTELQFLYGDTNYLNIYHLKLLAGRNLISDTTKEFVINEALMRTLGFKNPQDAIGKNILDGNSNQNNPIVGVMADFNQRSLRSGIEPMALIGDWSRKWFSQFQYVHISLQKDHPENWSDAITKVNNAWRQIYPGEDFEYSFVDENVRKFYESETRIATLLNWATALSVIISCLGLLGLVIHTTERRTKEIGIRKILGASILRINVLLCKDFLMLVGIAFIIAVPFAWWGINSWLENFAYKTSLSWWIFAISGIGLFLIALLIMSIKTIRTAMKNPVDSLRTE
ncbi:MAG TPA: FtsX-like permease family protein [Leeuwenhoekiella sp.]|nr:FtsX-like permease family protein [Leeuwenhoekiella sp.]